MKEEREKLNYAFRMKCYDDNLEYRNNMYRNILIANLLIIIYSLYMITQGYNCFIGPLLPCCISFVMNIVSDYLGAYYSAEISECEYIDDNFNKLKNNRYKYISCVNRIYMITFIAGLICMTICCISSL